MIPDSIFNEKEYTMTLAGKLYDYLDIEVQTIPSSEVPEEYLAIWKNDYSFKMENPCFRMIVRTDDTKTIFYMDAWEMSDESLNNPRTVFRFYVETRVNQARNYANFAFGSYDIWKDEEVDWEDADLEEVKPLYDFLGKETWTRFFNAEATY